MASALAKREHRGLRSWFERPFPLLRQEIDDIFARFNGDEFPSVGLSLDVDVTETEKSVEIRVDAPGLEAEEFDVRVNNNVLTISGERKEEKDEKSATVHRVERRYGRFSKSVWLPCEVNGDEAVAEYANGVLKLSLPKTEASNHKIKVKG